MHVRRPLLALVAVASLSVPVRAAAQRWQVDLAGNTVGYDTAARVTSASVAPLIEWDRGIEYATLSGALSAFEGGQWTSQGHGDLSFLFSPAHSAPSLRMEVVGSADGSVHSSGYRTAGTRGELRLHLTGRADGFWIGGTAASGWTSGSTGITTTYGPTAGAWSRYGVWNATAVWTPFRLAGGWYQQIEGRVSTSVGRVDVTGSAGWRGVPSGSGLSSSAWEGGSVALWFAPQAAFVFGAGSYPADLLQALPRGRYVSASIRLARRRATVWVRPWPGRTLYTQARGGGELRFAVPGAARVDVVGDWTGWQPLPLVRAPDGRWVLQVSLAPGVYRFNLVVDGAHWIAPEGVGSVDDGFGGKIGLFVVP